MPVPDPPPIDELRRIAPDLHEVPRGTALWRIYYRSGTHPTNWNTFRTFGPTNLRFDHHDPPPSLQRRGVLYAAEQALTCFAEVFQDTRTIDCSTREPWLVAFKTRIPLKLLDLRYVWPTRVGASQEINMGDRERARLWSRAFYDSYPDVHGLYYPSKIHGGAVSIVLYERAQHVCPSRPSLNLPLTADVLIHRIENAAADLRYEVV